MKHDHLVSVYGIRDASVKRPVIKKLKQLKNPANREKKEIIFSPHSEITSAGGGNGKSGVGKAFARAKKKLQLLKNNGDRDRHIRRLADKIERLETGMENARLDREQKELEKAQEQ